jgi:hypothetical protein
VEAIVDVVVVGQSVKDTHGLPFVPLQGWLPASHRRRLELVPGGRRPIVAVLDTGVAQHHWFTGPAGDPALVHASELLGWDEPGGPDLGSWHGTFVAGLIRVNAPDAQIVSIPLRRTAEGGIESGQLRSGLQALRQWMDEEPGRLVDVVCLAVGFRVLSRDNETYADELTALIGELGARGTIVVAAAGNIIDGQAAPLAPAVDATVFAGQAAPALVAVGAVDKDGNVAPFSTTGPWVTHKYVGVDVLSATPKIDQNAVQAVDEEAELDSTVHGTVAGFSLGEGDVGAVFGRGSGTSYAAAGFAGLLAQSMLDGPDGVRDVTPAAAKSRVTKALYDVREWACE